MQSLKVLLAIGVVSTPLLLVMSGPCPEGQDYFRGSCYLWGDVKKVINEAEQICKAMDPPAHLIKVNTRAEHDWIVQMATPKAAALSTEYFAIGLNDKASQGTWVWHDGTIQYSTVITGVDTGYFRNWKSGEPNQLDLEHCCVLGLANCGTECGFVHNVQCGWSVMYACEREVYPSPSANLQVENTKKLTDWDDGSCVEISNEKPVTGRWLFVATASNLHLPSERPTKVTIKGYWLGCQRATEMEQYLHVQTTTCDTQGRCRAIDRQKDIVDDAPINNACLLLQSYVDDIIDGRTFCRYDCRCVDACEVSIEIIKYRKGNNPKLCSVEFY